MNKKWSLEIVWWIITLIVVVLVLLPIYTTSGEEYLFYSKNIISIVVFITLSRWLFLLRHTLFGWSRKVKFALIFMMIPLFFLCYSNLFDFQYYIDEYDIMSMLKSVPTKEKPAIARYIKYEYIFFGTGALITIFMIPFRMIMSLWTQTNRGTV